MDSTAIRARQLISCGVNQHADPINTIDPSGYFSLGGMMSGVGNMAINASMAYMRMEVGDMIATALLSPIINSVVSQMGISELNLPSGNMLLTSVVTGLATTCVATKGKRCYIKKLPLLSTGMSLPGHSAHILAAITGNGNTLNGTGIPLAIILIKRSTEHSRTWLRSNPTCKAKPAGFACDEYPYAKTWNGGKANYERDKVSLKPVPSRESSAQGGTLRSFYRRNNINSRDLYLNIAIPILPTFSIDKNGKLYFYK